MGRNLYVRKKYTTQMNIIKTIHLPNDVLRLMSDIATCKVKPSAQYNKVLNNPYLSIQATDKPNALQPPFILETEIDIGDQHPNALTVYIEPPCPDHQYTTELTCEVTLDDWIGQRDVTWFNTYDGSPALMDISDGFYFQATFDKAAFKSTDTNYYKCVLDVYVKPQ